MLSLQIASSPDSGHAGASLRASSAANRTVGRWSFRAFHVEQGVTSAQNQQLLLMRRRLNPEALPPLVKNYGGPQQLLDGGAVEVSHAAQIDC
jgi:hypothetical protein